MLSRLAAAVFPLACPGCGRPAEPVCAACATDLRPPSPASPPPGIDAWWSPLAYAGVARELVARAKYRGAHAVNAWLAELMVAELPPPLPSVVTSAPTTPDRRQERGFDHAALLAGHVARRLHRPQRRLLVRDRGAPQTGLAADARKRGPAIHTCERSPVSVLVVDDVATTGTTLAASAVALRAAGAEHVVAITAARTAPPG